MRVDAISIAFIAAASIIIFTTAFSLYISQFYYPQGMPVVDRLPSVSPDQPYSEPTPVPTATTHLAQARLATPTPVYTPSGVPLNFVRTWGMESLQFDASRPSQSFPQPPSPYSKMGSFYATRDGKPVVLLFKLPTCGYCKLETQAFLNATSRFGDEIVALEIDVSTAPYLYQPVFMDNSPQRMVPLTVIAGAYAHVGGPDSESEIPAEADAMAQAICLALSSVGKASQACG